jgi:putative transposase
MLRIAACVKALVCEGLRWLWLTMRSTSAVEAENLFLRRQLALYVEQGIKPRRIDSVTRIALTILSGFFGRSTDGGGYRCLLHGNKPAKSR